MKTKTTPQMIIRKAEKQDSQTLADLCTQLGYPSTPQQLESRIAQIIAFQQHALFVAESERGVIGFVHVHAYPLPETDFHAEVGGLVIDEYHRHRGIGRELLAEAEAWARAQGCQMLYVRSNVIRKEAHQFYIKYGYQILKSQFTFRKAL